METVSEDHCCAVVRVRRKAREARAKGIGSKGNRAEEDGSQRREDFHPPQLNSSPFPVAMTRGFHLFPSRTQKLSLSVPNVLGWTRPGSIGRRRIPFRRESFDSLLFLCSEAIIRRESHPDGASRKIPGMHIPALRPGQRKPHAGQS